MYLVSEAYLIYKNVLNKIFPGTSRGKRHRILTTAPCFFFMSVFSLVFPTLYTDINTD